jgi:hypothetical protein
MTAKRLDNRAVFLALAILVAPSVASAQFDGRAFRLPSARSAATAKGVVQKPQPQAIVVQPGAHQRRVYPGGTTVFPRQSSVIWVPAVVTADGRIFANFGYGYEQVFRSCSGAAVVGQPTVIAGNGAVLSAPAPTYTQPVPNQQTASQQMAAGSRAHNGAVVPTYSTCFSPYSSGGVIVYRFQ